MANKKGTRSSESTRTETPLDRAGPEKLDPKNRTAAGRDAGSEAPTKGPKPPRTPAHPTDPSKPSPDLIPETLVKHNPAQGSPSIRKNPEAGKARERRRDD